METAVIEWHSTKRKRKTDMNIENTILKNDEQVVLNLRKLYRKYGYACFKMGKFEEYDLYAQNKEFLISDRLITFTDTNGKLMALKPDVTLSIVKNYIYTPNFVNRLYYNENVYRVSEKTHQYKEIMQTGLECIGDLTLYNKCEVVSLAAKSLETVSSDMKAVAPTTSPMAPSSMSLRQVWMPAPM